MKLPVFILTLALTSIVFCPAQEAYTKAVSVRTLLKTSSDVSGRPVRYPTSGTPELTSVLVEIPVGQNTGWHSHPNPSVEYILQGKITVEDAKGVKRSFTAGDSFAELVNLKHCGYNTGNIPVRIIMVVAGETGSPISKK